MLVEEQTFEWKWVGKERRLWTNHCGEAESGNKRRRICRRSRAGADPRGGLKH